MGTRAQPHPAWPNHDIQAHLRAALPLGRHRRIHLRAVEVHVQRAPLGARRLPINKHGALSREKSLRSDP
eukprot:14723385-Alexandrium_andersonii.AAC.1